MWVLAPCIWISAPNLTIVSFRWCWGRGRWVPKDLLEVSSLVSGKKFPPTPWNCLPTWGSFLSVDRLSLQHLVCRCNVLNRSLFWKICEKLKAWKVDDRVFLRCWASLQHLAFVGSNHFWVSFAWIRENSLQKLIGWKIRSSFKFSRANFSILHTKSIDGQKRVLRADRLPRLAPTLFIQIFTYIGKTKLGKILQEKFSSRISSSLGPRASRDGSTGWKFSKVSLLLNLPYTMTIEMNFENL